MALARQQARAQARAAQKLYWDAVDDLNRALELNPDLTEARVFRASAYRYLDSLDLAAGDLETVLAREPDHPDGLLERGMIPPLMVMSTVRLPLMIMALLNLPLMNMLRMRKRPAPMAVGLSRS